VCYWDACAKLIKKRQLKMSTGIKNGKHHTINIYKATLFFLFLLTPCLLSFENGRDNEKTWVIVIDAGHGGRDPGALGSFSKEKDITLAIALKTGEYIEKNISNAKVIYTRKEDITIDLRDRPRVANKANADLFISIHANSGPKNVMGAETYFMGITKDQANLDVAMKENAVMLQEEDYSTKKYDGFDPTSTESYIMMSLTQKVFQQQSEDLAVSIQKQFRERVNRNDRDVKQAGFWVLFNTKMPSVLIETGFITNLAEEKYLNSKDGQDYLASSIFRACRDYLNAVEYRTGISFKKEELPVEKHDTVVSEPVITDNIMFMVQVKSSLKKIAINTQNFKGLNDIIELKAGGRFKYASGKFPESQEAIRYRAKIESLFPDAFVIAVKDTTVIDLHQALEEKRKIKNIIK
jgi:N-acetylmuramoyl-L-alanine amidase